MGVLKYRLRLVLLFYKGVSFDIAASRDLTVVTALN
jgi:hypothetical protein